MKSFKEDIEDATRLLHQIEQEEWDKKTRMIRAEVELLKHRLSFRQYAFKRLITVMKWVTDTETRRYRHGHINRDTWEALKDAVYKFYPRD